MANRLVTVLALAATTSCASHDTILDRSTLKISDNARVSAGNLVSDLERFPRVAEHLALAQEVYQRQLYLLKERRNKVRSRRRNLGFLSYGTFAAASLAGGGLAIVSEQDRAELHVDIAAMVGLAALGIATGAQIGALMQEDTSSIDAKVAQLELLYETMMDRLRELGREAAAPVCDPSTDDCPVVLAPADDLAARMAEAIEEFISGALAIHVKG